MTLTKLNINDFAWRIFLAFSMLCPIYYNNMKVMGMSTMRVGHEQMFQVGVTVLFIVTFLENVWLATFLLWSIFLYAYYNFPSIGGNYIMNLFMAAILYQVTYRLVNRERVKQIFIAVIALCVINLGMTVLQIFNADPLFQNSMSGGWNYDPVGIMGIKAISGVFSAICIPIALFFSPWLALAAVPALILSQCSSAVAATVVSILFLAWHHSRKSFGLLLVPIVLCGALYVAKDAKMNMMTDRANMWKLAMQDALQRPIVGMGLDSFRNVGALKPFLYFKDATNNNALRMAYNRKDGGWLKPSGYDMKYKMVTDANGAVQFDDNGKPIQEALVNPWDNPHNEFIGLIYEFGLVGFLIFCALLWDITRRLYRDPLVITLFAIFLVYLVSSIGQFPFHLARTAHLSVIFLACYYKLTENGQKEKRDGC